MRRTQKLLALVLALTLALSLGAGVFADYPAETKTQLADSYSGKTVILHSNDVHGAVEGYTYIAGLKKAFEAKGAEVILVDAGDFSQGTPYVSISKGANAVEMMNAVGYDVVTLGNHEFDFGYPQQKENLSKAKFKVLCADVLENGKPIYDPYYLFETKSGLKIGFFGMETPETQTKVKPDLIQSLRFLSKGELYTCAQTQIDALKAGGADLVIGLTHLGVYDESAIDGHRSLDLYANTTGIDLMIDGHSHSVMTAGENGEPVQSTGTKFAYVGVVVIDNGTKKIEDRFLMKTVETDEEGKVLSELPRDEAVSAKAKEIVDAVDAEYGAVFARSEVDLNGERAPGNRTEETNMGDLITDAMLWSVLKGGGLEVDNDHVVAITNGGGIRAWIHKGDVTMKDVNTVLPFGNTIAVVYVTGEELLEALEASTFQVPIGGYPQTKGLSFNLDLNETYDEGPLYPDSTYHAPASIRRVFLRSVNGLDFDPQAKYAVVTNNFCAVGGDTYYAFKAASAQFDTSIPLDEALMSYITEELKGVIPAEKYASPRGDQTYRGIEAQRTTQALKIDGAAKDAEIYNINDENYFKLRDIALLLNGTPAQFSVSYDESTNTVTIETGKPYAAIGGELEKGADRSESCVLTRQTILINGQRSASIRAYNLAGNNFFRLRDLGRALGFSVDYNEESRTMLVTTGTADSTQPVRPITEVRNLLPFTAQEAA